MLTPTSMLKSVFIILIALCVYGSFTQEVAAAVSQCGGVCGFTTNGSLDTCAPGLTCMHKPGTTYSICVNQSGGPQCGGSNPCCTILTGSVTRPTGVATSNPTAIPTANPLLTTAPTSSVPISSALSPTPTITSISGTPGNSAIGDCSGPLGTPDGKTDLFDFELFRREFNKSVTTMACDFNKNDQIEVTDFTDYVRIGIVGQ